MSEPLDVLAPVDLPARASNPDVRVRFCPSPTGQPARRDGPHGPVQLGLRPAHRRHVRVPDRGHRLRARHRGVLRAAAGRPDLAGPGLGRGPGGGRPVRPLPAVASASRSTRRPPATCWPPAGPTSASAPPRSSRSAASRPARRAAPPGTTATAATSPPTRPRRYRAEGRRPALRFRMPGTELTWDDLVRGPVTFAPEHVPDFVLVRGNGEPLYTLVNPVDDALMRITHVLRGEDLLSSTPRQIALYDALAEIGVSDGTTPRFGHLPYVMGEGNRKLSKRDPQSSLNLYREEGFLPEGLLNYLALLGWSMGEDREFFSKEQMAPRSRSSGSAPTRRASTSRSAPRSTPTGCARCPPTSWRAGCSRCWSSAGSCADPVSERGRATLAAAIPLVQERMETLGQAVGMLGFLFVDEASFAPDPDDAARMLGPGCRAGAEPPPATRWPGLDGVDGRRDRGGPAGGPHRGARAQAEGGVRLRCGWPSPAVGSRRRCSSRSSCSAGSAPWRGSTPRWPDRRTAGTRPTRAGHPWGRTRASHGVGWPRAGRHAVHAGPRRSAGPAVRRA